MDERERLEDEYYQLLLETLEKFDQTLPFVVQSGTTTIHEKMNVDILDLIRKKQEEIHELQLKLLCSDDEYEQEVKEAQLVPLDKEKLNVTRTADFITGLVVSLQLDFSRVSDLTHLMQQVYLLRSASDSS